MLKITLHDLIPDPVVPDLDTLLTMPIDQKMIRMYQREAVEPKDLMVELKESEIF